MLNVEGLNVNIGAVPVLRDARFDLQIGQVVGLIGRNGAGKTTFLRTLMGLLKLQSGAMKFDHFELQKTAPQERAHLGIGYMPEDRRLIRQLSAEDNICIPVWSIGIPDWEDRLAWVYEIISEAEEFRAHRASSLSGDQQKLVALARALMIGHKLLLLDEPSEGVAPVLARRISAILRDLKSEGVSVLIAEPNDAHCADLLDRTFSIERGAISASGAP